METLFSSLSNNSSNTNSFNENISSVLNTFPTSYQIKKYWCHLCKKDFSHIYDDSRDITCIYCGKTFCEILETDDISNESHPIHFKPYIVNSNNNDSNNNNNNNNFSHSDINQIIIGPVFVSHIIMGNDYNNNNDNFDNIINEIMLHDPNKYGNPPAAKKEIEKLKKCKISEELIKEFGIENSCGVCKDEFIVGEECLLMPCNHHFHGNCLLPWLKERNSCPICRYELPTDDADFELRKKQKLINNINNVQG